jgi:hypothetical protein
MAGFRRKFISAVASSKYWAANRPMSRSPAHQLILVRPNKSRGRGQWSQDDYDVWDSDGKIVGRIFQSSHAPLERPWFWTITCRVPHLPTDRGYASTLEDAMEAFKRAWKIA